jgi:hypothetical protein
MAVATLFMAIEDTRLEQPHLGERVLENKAYSYVQSTNNYEV